MLLEREKGSFETGYLRYTYTARIHDTGNSSANAEHPKRADHQKRAAASTPGATASWVRRRKLNEKDITSAVRVKRGALYL